MDCHFLLDVPTVTAPVTHFVLIYLPMLVCELLIHFGITKHRTVPGTQKVLQRSVTNK